MLFDAIEFSTLIASGDVFYDLAFLLMDLSQRELAAPANIVLNRYLIECRRTEDTRRVGGPAFLPLHAGGNSREGDGGAPRACAARTNAHDRTGRAQLFRLCIPRHRAPCSGAGRNRRAFRYREISSRARAGARLGATPGAVVLRSDVERKILFGRNEHDKLPQEAYTPAVTARIYAVIADKARRAVAAGHCAIVDAVFAKPQERAVMRQSADALGVPFPRPLSRG